MLKASQVILWTPAASIRWALGSNICRDNNTIEEIWDCLQWVNINLITLCWVFGWKVKEGKLSWTLFGSFWVGKGRTKCFFLPPQKWAGVEGFILKREIVLILSFTSLNIHTRGNNSLPSPSLTSPSLSLLKNT